MKLSASTKFAFLFLFPALFLIFLFGLWLLLDEALLKASAFISSGIIVLLTGNSLKETVSHPDFFIKRIFGVYERKGVSFWTYIFKKNTIPTNAEIPHYEGGLSLIWPWEECIPVFGGEKVFKNEIKDVFSPNDGVSIESHLENVLSFSSCHMSGALKKCGPVKDKITEDHLKNVSILFFNIVEPEFRLSLKEFADIDKNSTYNDIVKSIKSLTTTLKTKVESLTDVATTSNNDHLIEKFGVLASDYNLELRPDPKVENAKEGITVAKLNKEAAINDIQIKKDVLTAIGTAIEETTGGKPDQKAMTELALSMFGNSQNILFMGNTGGKNPAIAVNTQKNQGGKK